MTSLPLLLIVASTPQAADVSMASVATEPHVLRLPNDADLSGLDLQGVARIELDIPKFTDGRAFSQAHVLRRRGFAGDIRATGDVLIDQLLQLQRSGFTSAVLREGQDAVHGARLLAHYSGFYQGDVQNLPHFVRAA
jgi:uncharacterized protein (DUF934 family)